MKYKVDPLKLKLLPKLKSRSNKSIFW